MKVTIYNNKYDDKITFTIDELNNETKQEILNKVHSMGWKDEDCWSDCEE